MYVLDVSMSRGRHNWVLENRKQLSLWDGLGGIAQAITSDNSKNKNNNNNDNLKSHQRVPK